VRVVGVGLDAAEVGRVARALRRPGFEERVFTPAERAYCRSRGVPEEHFAARFAAKEAVAKALGTGLLALGLRNVEVAGSAPPGVRLAGRAREVAEERGVRDFFISLTTEAGLAMALVLAVGE
jgi:holo-[acyl-carrier protein] synthase